MSKGYAEMMRIIREVEPHKPSTRLSSLGDTGTRTAQQRRAVDPKKLSQTLKGDLDWIVAAALLIGVIGTTWGMVWAVRERDRARESAKEALTAAEQTRRTSKFLTTMLASADPHESGNPTMTVRELLDEAAMKAQAELGDQPEVQADVFSTIGMAKRHLGQTRAAEQHLRKALELREWTFGAEHALVAESRYNLAWALHDLPDYPQAERECRAALEMRRRVLGDDHPAVAESLAMLGDLTKHTGDLKAAETYFDEALRILRAKTGDDDPRTLDALAGLALVYEEQSRFNEAETVLRRVVETQRRVSGESHPKTLTSMRILARIVGLNLGRLDEGEAMIREALTKNRALYPNGHKQTAWSLSLLAQMQESRGNLEEAQQTIRESLEMTRKVLGSDHIEVAWRLHHLADVLRRRGRNDEAELLLRDGLAILQRSYGDAHRETVWRRIGLCVYLRDKGEHTEAELLCAAAVSGAQKLWGARSIETARTLAQHGHTLGEMGRVAEAIPLLEEAYRTTKKHPPMAWVGPTLLKAYVEAADPAKPGDTARVVARMQEMAADARATLPKDSPELAGQLASLGWTLRDLKQWDEIIPLLEEAYQRSKEHPPMAWVGPALLKAYTKAADPAKPGDTARVVALTREMIAAARATLPKDSPELARQLASFGWTLLYLKQWDEADPVIREALTIREKVQPDAWTTFNAKSMLGAALLGRKKLAEAEPLLLEGYRGMKDREAAIPPQGKARIPEALERLAQLYEAKGNESEAAEWKAKFDAAAP